jgi:hypothetical protein
MKPLNFDNSPCSPTSSNCVIWGGPDLPCINLCKGDSITDVVEKIALELCTILDTLNITAYDLTCFNLANCSPQTFTDLINFLIVKVCELDNASTSTGGGGTNPPTPSSGCPTDCFVDVAPCFVTGGVTTMNLTNYVTTIGTRICTLVTTITLQQNQIDNLNVRVTDLETTPPPSYTTPTMVMAYELPSVPSLAAGSTQPINVVIDSYVNQIWFPFVAITGNTGTLSTSVSNQTVAATDMSKVNPAAQMSAQYPGLWTTPTATIAGTINNLWACIKDLRNAPTVRSVTGLNTDNADPLNPIVKISVDGTTITGDGTPASPLVNGGVTKIIAGTNVTLTPTTGVGDVTVDVAVAGVFTHYIGELYGGGIVIAVWKEAGVEKGLIASLVNLSYGLEWALAAYDTITVPGAGAINRYDGLSNTNAIISQTGSPASGLYAAGLTDLYAGGGFTNWYLPSIWELNTLFNVAPIINKILEAVGGYDLLSYNETYWSSTEFSPSSAYAQSFDYGSIGAVSKSNSFNAIRAIRAF